MVGSSMESTLAEFPGRRNVTYGYFHETISSGEPAESHQIIAPQRRQLAKLDLSIQEKRSPLEFRSGLNQLGKVEMQSEGMEG